MAIIASDNFNRTDNTDLGANWEPTSAQSRFGIVSNHAEPSTLLSDCQEIYTGTSFPNDQYAEAKITTGGSDTNSGVGVCVRMSATGSAGYVVVVNKAGSDNVTLFKNGFNTEITSFTTTWVDGDRLRLEAFENRLRVFQNGTLIGSTTDSTHTSGSPGISYSSEVTTGFADDWEAGDLSAYHIPAISTKVRRSRIRRAPTDRRVPKKNLTAFRLATAAALQASVTGTATLDGILTGGTEPSRVAALSFPIQLRRVHNIAGRAADFRAQGKRFKLHKVDAVASQLQGSVFGSAFINALLTADAEWYRPIPTPVVTIPVSTSAQFLAAINTAVDNVHTRIEMAPGTYPGLGQVVITNKRRLQIMAKDWGHVILMNGAISMQSDEMWTIGLEMTNPGAGSAPSNVNTQITGCQSSNIINCFIHDWEAPIRENNLYLNGASAGDTLTYGCINFHGRHIMYLQGDMTLKRNYLVHSFLGETNDEPYGSGDYSNAYVIHNYSSQPNLICNRKYIESIFTRGPGLVGPQHDGITHDVEFKDSIFWQCGIREYRKPVELKVNGCRFYEHGIDDPVPRGGTTQLALETLHAVGDLEYPYFHPTVLKNCLFYKLTDTGRSNITVKTTRYIGGGINDLGIGDLRPEDDVDFNSYYGFMRNQILASGLPNAAATTLASWRSLTLARGKQWDTNSTFTAGPPPDYYKIWDNKYDLNRAMIAVFGYNTGSVAVTLPRAGDVYEIHTGGWGTPVYSGTSFTVNTSSGPFFGIIKYSAAAANLSASVTASATVGARLSVADNLKGDVTATATVSATLTAVAAAPPVVVILPSKPKIFIVEQNIAIEISMVNDPATIWTADSAAYYYNLGTRNEFAAVRRKIVSVTLGSEELDVASDGYQQVIATNKTWWYQAATNRLYVNPEAAINPITRIVLARFKLFWSNYQLEFNGEVYEDRLDATPEDTSVRVAVDNNFWSEQPLLSGAFTLINGDPKLDPYTIDDILKNYVVIGQACEKAELISTVSGSGAGSGVATSKEVITSGYVGEIIRTDQQVRFDLWS